MYVPRCTYLFDSGMFGRGGSCNLYVCGSVKAEQREVYGGAYREREQSASSVSCFVPFCLVLFRVIMTSRGVAVAWYE